MRGGGGGHTLQHPVQQLFLVGMMAPIHGGGKKDSDWNEYRQQR